MDECDDVRRSRDETACGSVGVYYVGVHAACQSQNRVVCERVNVCWACIAVECRVRGERGGSLACVGAPALALTSAQERSTFHQLAYTHGREASDKEEL